MRITSVVLLPFVASVAATSHAGAQNSSTHPGMSPVVLASYDGTPARAAVARMQSALRQLVTAEERYWSDHGTYTTDASVLGLFTKGSRAPDVAFVQVIFAGGRGWTGMATDRALTGKSCVVYVGLADELPAVPRTRADRTPAEHEGAPTCDVVP